MKSTFTTHTARRRRHAIVSTLVLVVSSSSSMMTAAALSCKNAQGVAEDIPEARINDGYCDCWETGEDERTTDACAGVDYWGAALLHTTPADDPADRPFFQCPQQEHLQLPTSRVNDGICDCCDGADEIHYKTTCSDTCAKLKAAQAAARAQLQERYEKGSKLRTLAVETFQTLRNESERQLETLQSELETEQSKLDMLTREFVEAKRDFVKQRIDRLNQQQHQLSLTMFQGLNQAELKQVIVLACQLTGEMSVGGSRCEALMLAALDVGLGLEKPTLNQDNLADIIYYNAQNPNDPVVNVAELNSKKPKRNKKGRRLMRVVAADDVPDDIEDYEDDYTDDYHHGEDEDESDEEQRYDESPKSEERKAIEQFSFSKSRVRFLEKAASLQKLVEDAKQLRQNKDAFDDQVKSLDPEELERRAKLKDLVAMDEKEFKLLKKTLSDRKRVIERGFDFAVSAKSLIEEISEVSILEKLALGTVYHGKLSAVHLYQILASTLFIVEDGDDSSQTCTTAAGMICPPKSIVRDNVSIPSNGILEAVKTYCDGASVPDGQQDTCVDESALQADLPDGFAGYYEVFPCEDDEDWHSQLDKVLSTTDEEAAMLVDVIDKESKADAAAVTTKDIERRIKDIEDSIGIDDEGKYGPDGALHSIRNECFSTTAGKYTYELCMYKKAAQKDGGSSTNLGQWAGATFDDNEGHIWRWEGGQKCWNGPKRSATAYIECGAETVVLSADEPDTCRYTFKVQSPIACDDVFRQKYELS